MHRTILFLGLGLLLSTCLSWAPASGTAPSSTPIEERSLTVVSYNLENLFDPTDDPATADDEFTPQGARRWSYYRLFRKLQRLSSVIVDVGQGVPPALVGCIEIENDTVAEYWTHRSPLKRLGYDYVITHSADPRGINIALLYQPTQFRMLGCESFRPTMPESVKPTRDVLHAWGLVQSGDTLDVVLMHCPSRRGGTRTSMPAREAVHRLLLQVSDSLLQVRSHPYLVMMGDVNDYPDTKSLIQHMHLKHPQVLPLDSRSLYNLMQPLQQELRKNPDRIGSHKFAGEWGYLDQFWVSGTLLLGNSDGCGLMVDTVHSFAPDYLLTDDTRYFGQRPLRTYQGFQYEDGFSDHLPVVLRLSMRYLGE